MIDNIVAYQIVIEDFIPKTNKTRFSRPHTFFKVINSKMPIFWPLIWQNAQTWKNYKKMPNLSLKKKLLFFGCVLFIVKCPLSILILYFFIYWGKTFVQQLFVATLSLSAVCVGRLKYTLWRGYWGFAPP